MYILDKEIIDSLINKEEFYKKFGFEEIGLGMYLWDAPTRFYRKSLT